GLLAGIHGLFNGRYYGLSQEGYLQFLGKIRGYKLAMEEEVEENEGLKEVWEQMEYVISDSDSDFESTTRGLLAGIHGLFNGRYYGLSQEGYLQFLRKFCRYKLAMEEEVEENEVLKEVWEQMEYVISDSDSDFKSTASS
nr:hypothetical protein [Tanacetum cinerariifolium]